MKTLSTHEDLSRQHSVRGPSDRNFGLVFTAFFLLLGLAPLRKHHPTRLWALVLALAFVVIVAVRPTLLRPLNKAWMELGHLLGRVMTPVVTGLLFFVVFAPAGLVMRLMGKDPLNLSFDKEARSYWIERHPPGPAPEEMANQF
ncbi:MAG TPA: SxtJ family membrane protein [Bryobacteraceae bacterium]|jgi:hypothetical protein|nr:SxtJ family membrane protein [Bryobacteraceae bacterium]